QPEPFCLREPSQPANDGSHRRPGTFRARLPTRRVRAGSLRRLVDRREHGWDFARPTTSQSLQSELRGHRTMSWDEWVLRHSTPRIVVYAGRLLTSASPAFGTPK